MHDNITAVIEHDIAAAHDLIRAVARVEETGAALLESFRKLDLWHLSQHLEALAPCPRPNLIGWLDVTIDELKEAGISEGMTPSEAINAAYLEWIARGTDHE